MRTAGAVTGPATRASRHVGGIKVSARVRPAVSLAGTQLQCARPQPDNKRPLLRALPDTAQVKNEVHKNTGFVAEMRKVAMKLHTKDQAPKEGGKAASKTPMSAWKPTREGYLQFLTQSKAVYDTFEEIIDTEPAYAAFRSSGLERGAALAADLQWFESEYSLTAPCVTADSPAATYTALLRRLARDDPAAFICHYYNFYFAHTAGGRMIGSKVSSMILDNKVLQFYQWEVDVTDSLEAVRAEINKIAEGWDSEQKKHCLEETAASFQYSGSLMRSLMA